ncbi:hypothetical protein BD779DRAFT_1679846 [Infundibulicybe gibba]|nr:hypothetical protein BD779DRAFT_1679846 [Infundibulicybe gibba]
MVWGFFFLRVVVGSGISGSVPVDRLRVMTGGAGFGVGALDFGGDFSRLCHAFFDDPDGVVTMRLNGRRIYRVEGETGVGNGNEVAEHLLSPRGGLQMNGYELLQAQTGQVRGGTKEEGKKTRERDRFETFDEITNESSTVD